jgi:hypothetical protein
MRKYMNKCSKHLFSEISFGDRVRFWKYCHYDIDLNHLCVCASKLKNMFKKSEETVCRMERNYRFQNICPLYKSMSGQTSFQWDFFWWPCTFLKILSLWYRPEQIFFHPVTVINLYGFFQIGCARTCILIFAVCDLDQDNSVYL